ncbi:unnamed protein product [Ectocarpus sp. 4 AP-2014]
MALLCDRLAGYNMAATLTAAENDHEPAGSSTPSASRSASPRRKGPPPAPHPRFYDHVPFWRSNLAACGVVMEGLGDVDPSLRTMGVWLGCGEENRKDSYKRGVVYYMRDDKVAGILLLNLSDQLEAAREVLRQQRRISTAAQLERLIDVSIRMEGDIALEGAAAAAAAAASGRNVRVVETPGCSSLRREP